jgi:hypothetical protein
MGGMSDQEFVNQLRAAVVAYLDAVDRWEAAYSRYFRMPDAPQTVSSDMQAEQQEYEAQRAQLEAFLPRARSLCLKHRLRNPFPGLVRISLGRYAPPHRIDPAIGRNERNAVMDCLVQLTAACSGWVPEAAEQLPDSPAPARGRRTNRVLLAAILTIAAISLALLARRSLPTTRRPRPLPYPTRPAIRPRNTGAMHFYRIQERPLTNWGDYGDILQHGMTAHLERTGGLLSLERTGPYMPPITFPGIGDIVLTTSGRRLLEASGLSGFTFRPVHKTRIVDLAWNQWDLTKDEPPQYPASGEPEDYILERPANARIAREMGDIWELVIPVTAKIGRPRENVQTFHELYVLRDSWNGDDIFCGDGYRNPIFTQRAKDWVERNFGAYAQFEEFAAR